MPNGHHFCCSAKERNFRRANELIRRGGISAATCGAPTRVGSACQQIPLIGSTRCIRHCGPKAAKEFRERQRNLFLYGKLSHAEWMYAESKRERNRLRDRWKKNQWLPGSTIDLGLHESRFEEATRAVARSFANPTPPAVLDWLRWRYQRLQIDRKRDDDWTSVLQNELPKRLLAAGPPPAIYERQENQGPVSAVVLGSDKVSGPFSKRSQLDRPKAAALIKPKSLRGRGRPKCRTEPSFDEQQETAHFVMTYRDTLVPLFEICMADEQRDIIEALRAFVADPNDRTARERWMRVALAMQARQRLG